MANKESSHIYKTISARESCARRLARQRGLKLIKNRSRDDRLPNYRGFMLLYIDTNNIAAGCFQNVYDLNLDEVESELTCWVLVKNDECAARQRT
jgi:hypothetical protein